MKRKYCIFCYPKVTFKKWSQAKFHMRKKHNKCPFFIEKYIVFMP